MKKPNTKLIMLYYYHYKKCFIDHCRVVAFVFVLNYKMMHLCLH